MRIDSTPPTTIQNFFIENVSSNEISLAWTPTYDLSFAAYQIYYSTDPNVSHLNSCWDYANDPNLQFIGSGLVRTTITGLNQSTRYYFVLSALDDRGNFSDYPIEITAMTSSGGKPLPPQNVEIMIVGNDIHIDWDDVEYDTSGNEITPNRYDIYVSEEAEFDCSIDTFLDFTTDSSFVIEGIASEIPRLFFKIITVVGSVRE